MTHVRTRWSLAGTAAVVGLPLAMVFLAFGSGLPAGRSQDPRGTVLGPGTWVPIVTDVEVKEVGIRTRTGNYYRSSDGSYALFLDSPGAEGYSAAIANISLRQFVSDRPGLGWMIQPLDVGPGGRTPPPALKTDARPFTFEGWDAYRIDSIQGVRSLVSAA